MAKIGFVSLGCAKNLVDSEVMLGLLAREGHEITSQPEQAEVIVVNTCGFIESAKQESIEAILEMAQHKIIGKCHRLIVAGCLAERYRAQIVEQIPEVDAVIGTNEVPGITELIRSSNGSDVAPALWAGDPLKAGVPRLAEPRIPRPTGPWLQHGMPDYYLYDDKTPRILAGPPYTAYIKIAEGCDHPCAFCVIPKMRGTFRSRPIESILREAADLATRGVKEINLIGQDTTMYGWDWGHRRALAELIRRLGRVKGIEWIRVLYLYPNNVYDELLDAIAETPAACKYIDIPLQHASRSVLKSMKRGGNRDSLTRLIERIRSRVPGASVRTTMIVGFPGESEEDFQELLDFVNEIRFDRLGAFAFSDEEDAASYSLNGKLSAEIKHERRKRLMQAQSRISRDKNRSLVGKTFPVLVHGPSADTELLWEGRLPSQAPEIDGVVYLNDGVSEETRPGDLVRARITKSHEYDLVGCVV